MAEELNPGSTWGFNSAVQLTGKDITSSRLLNATQCICDDLSSQLRADTDHIGEHEQSNIPHTYHI